MDNLKFGVVLSGLVGLIACFLPLGPGLVNFWDMRQHAPGDTYMTLAAYAVGFVVPGLAVLKPPIVRWQAIVAALSFAFVLVKLRAVLGVFFSEGNLGAKLMVIAPVMGLVFSVLCLVKPALAAPRDD